jgi:hypothetical protein
MESCIVGFFLVNNEVNGFYTTDLIFLNTLEIGDNNFYNGENNFPSIGENTLTNTPPNPLRIFPKKPTGFKNNFQIDRITYLYNHLNNNYPLLNIHLNHYDLKIYLFRKPNNDENILISGWKNFYIEPKIVFGIYKILVLIVDIKDNNLFLKFNSFFFSLICSEIFCVFCFSYILSDTFLFFNSFCNSFDLVIFVNLDSSNSIISSNLLTTSFMKDV